MIENILFPVGYSAEDVYFTCHVFAKCHKIALIENELYHWRIRQGSLSQSFPTHDLQALSIIFHCAQFLKEPYPKISTNCKSMICSRCLWIYSELKFVRNYEASAKAMKECMDMRRKIHFTLKEWLECSFKNKIIILFSTPSLIKLGGWLRYIRFKIKNND